MRKSADPDLSQNPKALGLRLCLVWFGSAQAIRVAPVVYSPKRYHLQCGIIRHMLALIIACSPACLACRLTIDTHGQGRRRCSARRTTFRDLILRSQFSLLRSPHRQLCRISAIIRYTRTSCARWISSVTFKLLLSLQIDQHIWTPDANGISGRTYYTDHRKLSYWQDHVGQDP